MIQRSKAIKPNKVAPIPSKHESGVRFPEMFFIPYILPYWSHGRSVAVTLRSEASKAMPVPAC
jgi:hypothetical protein